MKNIFFVAGLLVCITATAQSNNKGSKNAKSFLKQLTFHSINQVGITEGQNGTSFYLQTINGVEKNFWFAGIGAAIDHYHLRTVPVFLDIRKNIFNKEKSPFIYADAGISYPWQKKEDENMWYKTEYKNRSYYDIGLGYNLPVNKLGAFILSMGYSEKKLTQENYTYNYLIFSGTNYPGNPKNQTDYKFRRISIKAGWRF
jgi:hypothetical protein